MQNNKKHSNNKSQHRSISSSIFKNNKIVFVLSLLIAIVLWVTVSPDRSVTIGMTLNIKNTTAIDKLGLEVINGQNQHIKVNVTGKWYVISELTEKDIELNYSLNEITKPGEYEIALTANKLSNNSNYSITSVTPDVVRVSFDSIIKRSFAVECSAPDITAKEGYILEAPVVNTDSSLIEITGPMSVVEKISKVEAKVDVKAVLNNSTSYKVPINAYDEKGRVIDTEYLNLPFTEVDVTVPISKSKKIDLKVDFSNAPDYYVKNPLDYELSVSSLNVIGTPDVIEKLEELNIGTIDFADITKANNKFSFSLNLPSGVRTVDDVTEISCVVDVSGFSSKAVKVTNIKPINVPQGSTAKVITTKKSVDIMAPKSIISSIKDSDIYLECDLENKTGEFIVEKVNLKSEFGTVWGTGDYKKIQIKVS